MFYVVYLLAFKEISKWKSLILTLGPMVAGIATWVKMFVGNWEESLAAGGYLALYGVFFFTELKRLILLHFQDVRSLSQPRVTMMERELRAWFLQ